MSGHDSIGKNHCFRSIYLSVERTTSFHKQWIYPNEFKRKKFGILERKYFNFQSPIFFRGELQCAIANKGKLYLYVVYVECTRINYFESWEISRSEKNKMLPSNFGWFLGYQHSAYGNRFFFFFIQSTYLIPKTCWLLEMFAHAQATDDEFGSLTA